MYNEFPFIQTIDDILPAIEGRKEFVVAERDGYTIINYNVMFPDTFPDVHEITEYTKMVKPRADKYFKKSESSGYFYRADYNRLAALRRECRGIIFDSTGKIIRRPLQKFFNINEREETLFCNLDFNLPHTIYDKLDGSMIAPFIVNDEIIWATKMAAPDFHNAVKAFVDKQYGYKDWVRFWISKNYTPIFEWTAPENRIVVQYKEAKLTLLAIRHMQTGQYLSLAGCNVLEGGGLIPKVKSYDSITDINQFIIDTRSLTDCEGFVICWENGYRVKAKCDWYVQIHKAKEKILQERNVLEMILSNTIDDVLAFLPEEDKTRINLYNHEAMYHITNWIGDLYDMFETTKLRYGDDRKGFAIEAAAKLHPYEKSTIFAFWDRREEAENLITDHCLNLIKSKCNNNKNFAEMKDYIMSETSYKPYDIIE